jgi:hypothetical protein
VKKIIYAGLGCAAAVAIIAATMLPSDKQLIDWRAATHGSFAHVVNDPFGGGDKVLAFAQSNSSADIYSRDAYRAGTIDFDYMGSLSLSSEGGGFVGISTGQPGKHFWLAGAGQRELAVTLINDGTWNHYSVPFDAKDNAEGSAHIVLAQLSTGTADQAMFRNLRVSDQQLLPVSKGHALALTVAAIALLAYVIRGKKSNVVQWQRRAPQLEA